MSTSSRTRTQCTTAVLVLLVAAVLIPPVAAAGNRHGRRRRANTRFSEVGFQVAEFLLPLVQQTEQLLPTVAQETWASGSGGVDYFCSRCRNTKGKPKEVIETSEAWLITLDTAGFSREELELTIKGDQLSVKGRHTCAKVPEQLCIPRELDRTYDLNAVTVAPDRLSSRRTADGVLQITIPKASARKIKIDIEDAAAPEDPEPAPKSAQPPRQATPGSEGGTELPRARADALGRADEHRGPEEHYGIEVTGTAPPPNGVGTSTNPESMQTAGSSDDGSDDTPIEVVG